jgi:hypothetical protein
MRALASAGRLIGYLALGMLLAIPYAREQRWRDGWLETPEGIKWANAKRDRGIRVGLRRQARRIRALQRKDR